ncbi:MAG: class I SAM-dependent methyltransferase [Sandaracinaceae bacterium]
MTASRILLLSLVLALGACGGTAADTTSDDTVSDTTGDESAPPSALDVPSGDLAAAIAGAHRSDDNRTRDAYRHPLETLTFFGIQPNMHVIEVRPGGGWYTEILAPYLRDQGELVAAIPSAEGRRAQYRQRFLDRQSSRPDVFGGLETVVFEPPAPIELGEDGSTDMVLTFRNTHNWVGDEGERQAFEAFFRVLRPGGVLGVVQHRAAEGADPQAGTGYVPEAYVIEVAQAAGFVLEESSELNANPNDTHDHPEGVWTLPPVYRLGDADRATYEAIGESDRMTLRFRRPQ